MHSLNDFTGNFNGQVMIIVIVIGLTLGFDLYALKFYWSDDYTMWLPRNGGKLFLCQ